MSIGPNGPKQTVWTVVAHGIISNTLSVKYVKSCLLNLPALPFHVGTYKLYSNFIHLVIVNIVPKGQNKEFEPGTAIGAIPNAFFV